jgi:hypothetical protein
VNYPEFNLINNQSICLGDTVLWDLQSVGPYTYDWSTGSNDTAILIYEAGTYTVTLTDTMGNQWSSDPITISIDSFPIQNDLGPDKSVCKNEILGLEVEGDNIVSYFWDTGDETSEIPVLNSGDYFVTVTNSNGCSAIDSINIFVKGEAPEIDFWFDTVCFGTSTSFTDVSIIFEQDSIQAWRWSFGNGDSAFVQNPDYLFASVDTFNVELVVLSDSGCMSSLTQQVINKESPVAAFKVKYGDVQCLGQEVFFENESDTVLSVDNFFWSFGDGSFDDIISPIHVFDDEGNFDVRHAVTLENGCSDTVGRILRVDDHLMIPEVPIANQPSNNYTLFKPETNILFDWRESNGAAYYEIQVSRNEDFSSVLFSEITDSTYYDAILADTGRYYWTVNALNLCLDSQRSDTLEFEYKYLNEDRIKLWMDASYKVDDLDVSTAYFINRINDDTIYQNEIASQPLLVENDTINGAWSFKFDGNDDSFKITDSIKVGAVLVVCNYSHENIVFPEYKGIINSSVAANNPYILMGNRNTDLFYSGGGSLFSNKIFVNQIQSLSFNPLSQFKLVYGFIENPVNFDSLRIGGAISDQNYWNGNIAEVIVFDTVPEESQIDDFYNYLRFKYSPPVNFINNINIPYGFADTTITSANKPWFTKYQWSTGENDTLSTLTVNEPGTYTVTVTDMFGFESSDSLVVNYPEFNLINNQSICLGDTVLWDLDAVGPYTYDWSTGSNDTAILIYEAGTYNVTLTDTMGNQWPSDPITVSIDSFPIQNDLGPDKSVCKNELLGLEVEGDNIVSYFWDTGDETSVIPVLNSGDYYITVTNSNGCSFVDSINVFVKGEAPEIDFLFDTVCFGTSTSFTDHSIIFEQDSIQAWRWSFGNGDSAFVQNPDYLFASVDTFNVELVVLSDSGCMSSLTQQVINKESPVAAFKVKYGDVQCLGQEVFFENESDTVLNVDNFFWSFGDGSFDDITSPIHVFNDEGNFDVRHAVTLENGCSDTVGRILRVDDHLMIPEVPIANQPSNNYTLFKPETNILFDWRESNGAAYYEIQVSKDEDFSSVLFSEITDSTYYDAILADTGRYYWTVNALNLCLDSQRSDTLEFEYKYLNEDRIKLWMDASYKVDDLDVSTAYFINRINDDTIYQNEIASQPLLVENDTINGAWSFKFDGNDDSFKITDSIKVGAVLVVCNYSHENIVFPEYSGIINSSVSTSNAYVLLGNRGSSDFYTGGGNLLGDNIIINQEQSLSFSPLNQFKIVYGFIENPVNFDSLRIGGAISDQNYWNGNIAEVIVFDTVPEESQIDDFYNYLRFKYSPPVNFINNIIIPYGFADTTITSANKPWFTKYQWSTGENDTLSTLTVNEPGTYTVTVTDMFGFESTDSIEVRYPEFNLWESRSICLGDTLIWDLDSKGPYSYEWSTGATEGAIQIYEAGTYTVTLTDTAGNQWSLDTVVITIDSFPRNANLGPDLTLCAGNRLRLEVGQDEAVDFLWHNGSNLPYYRIREPEEISVTVINQIGCVAQDTILVDVNGTAPKADFSYGTACRDLKVQFTDMSETFDESNINSYEWRFDMYDVSVNQNPEFAFPESGQVEVMLFIETDAGCDNDTTILLDIHDLPIANFSNSLACENASVSMSNTSVSFDGQIVSSLWLIEGQEYDEVNPIHTFTGQEAVPVQLIVQSEYDCPDTVIRNVAIKPAPNANFLASVACVGETVYFTNFTTTNLGQQYYSQWQFGDLGSSVERNPSFTFETNEQQTVELVVRNMADGCTDTIRKDIEIHNLPQARFPDQTGCEGVENILNHNSSMGEGELFGSIEWQFADTVLIGDSPVYSASEAGTYDVMIRVTNDAGCEDTNNGEYVVNGSPVVAFADLGDTLFYPTTLQLQNSSDEGQWSWFLNEELFSSDENPQINIDTSGLYVVKLNVVNESGCENTHIDSTLALTPLIDGGIMDCRAVIDQGRLYVSVDLANLGTKRVTNPELRLTLSNGQMFAETMSGNLYPGDEKTFSFRTQYFIPEGISLRWMIVEMLYEPDQANGNNQCSYVFGDESIIYAPYPNPAESFINLDFTSKEAGNVKIRIYNLKGEIVIDELREATQGLNRMQIPNPAPAGGVHTMEVEVNGERKTFRIIL